MQIDCFRITLDTNWSGIAYQSEPLWKAGSNNKENSSVTLEYTNGKKIKLIFQDNAIVWAPMNYLINIPMKTQNISKKKVSN
jgi:hypothetical protein